MSRIISENDVLSGQLEREFSGLAALLSLDEVAQLPYFTKRFLRNSPITKRKIRGRVYFAKADLIVFLVEKCRIKPL